MARELEKTDADRAGPYCLRGLRDASASVSLWAMVWTFFALLALVGTLPWFSAYSKAMDQRYEAGTLIENLTTAFRADHIQAFALLREGSQGATAALAFLAMLLGVFVAGGWLQVFLERSEDRTLRRFFMGGSRYFFRFFRLFVCMLVVLHVLRWIVYGFPWQFFVEKLLLGIPAGEHDQLGSEWSVVKLVWTQDTIWAVAFGLALTWADYTRTRLALHDTSSAVWALICTFFVMLRHPVRTLRPMIALLVIEILVVLVAAAISTYLENDLSSSTGRAGLLPIFLVGQLALAWSIITRGARYHTAVAVSREIVRPISRPDPWKHTLGGPGGPRYPIEGGEDEYGVVL
jgi:hypothetical protein